jgi:ERCC4-related helicase
MSIWHPYFEPIRLFVEGRISSEDANRQTATAREILRRLPHQAGVVLADEVGMGKTFVALAVAASVALSDKKHRPVIVMVPPTLKEKWPEEFTVFAERCLPPEAAVRVRASSTDSAVGFLKFLDDPLHRRNSILFLTHGSMHRGLKDGWVKLAVIQRALRRRHNTGPLRRAFVRCAGSLLRLGWVERGAPVIWDRLLEAPPKEWLNILSRNGIALDDKDDPVPQAVVNVLRDFDTSAVYEVLHEIPHRQSATYNERVEAARHKLNELLKEVWRQCITRLDLCLPLLIMDEAHHLKNPEARMSGLFQLPDAKDDAEEISRGALGGVFERMLFLTATPFQLGHHELCSVLERFDGIAWRSANAPLNGREAFQNELRVLRERLDAAQRAALNLDTAWGLLRCEDLVVNGTSFPDSDAWWAAAQSGTGLTSSGERVTASYRCTFEKMRAAENSLRPWVIRHLKPRSFAGRPRRERLPGAAIEHDNVEAHESGLRLSDVALLPFLLAARATVYAPDSRPIFAEGLASSYEAFLHTRKSSHAATDEDDDRATDDDSEDPIGEWYLNQLEQSLRSQGGQTSSTHPKVAATAQRVLNAWKQGEKVLVFCHYIATGRVLRQEISRLLREQIERQGAEKLGCKFGEASERLERYGRRFFDTDSPVRKACDDEVMEILRPYSALRAHHAHLLEVTRRYLRTPSFLARYFPLDQDRFDVAAIEKAFGASDASGLSLRKVLQGFFEFLEYRCVERERVHYLDAIHHIQTGSISGKEAIGAFAEDELQGGGAELLLPNVRLVNGSTKQETRQRLMRTFNSPFFPEVLISSSIMAEGVDLHRFCRFVIHHDLCWNPSTLEQRTGRVDRIGAKVEQCGQPIRIYLPYVAETQDEKMYRVVTDRERWLSVVMGEKFDVDARSTEKLAQRVPLPESLARVLAFRLEVTD